MKQEILSAMVIRNLQTVEELEKVRQLEVMIWGLEDSVPVNQSVAAVKNGGFILGAFLKEELIGFQYNFPGFNGKKIYLCSHSLGIHPDYRKFGIGEKLKIAQRETAIGIGYDLITWTYDPLETVNGNLNLHKLKAVCNTYMENAYGEMPDNMNAGIPTDRFLVEWWIKEPIEKTEPDKGHSLVIKTSTNGSFLTPHEMDLMQVNDSLFVPVPGNFQEIKKHNFPLALSWRERTRKVFSYYLSQGWTVTDLVKDDEQSNQYLYLLEKGAHRHGN
ncbi:putative GNAT superfamily acetyltransferase [Bacillus pakistanensis]|uniref:GNAT superfamily acetyltransferase n=1 Tax=Rossellomorea pakistanensis TaxID=992288 RepID=A0ABS2NH65_9BACI|nr:GNAT family N-acetyltransferase [Bacillus pakistanensis]MBM7587174.1 putative GNAT superfamily acetyltransferase [Bacillus pakistanensis]